MVYSPQMGDLKPPRSFLVTLAGILAVITGIFWLALTGSFLVSGPFSRRDFSGLRHARMIALIIIPVCMSVATVIAGLGVLVRRNSARTFAIALAAAWILYGLWFLSPLRLLPASQIRVIHITPLVLPFLPPIAWLLLLVGKKVRSEFLPPAKVQIYVNLLNEGAPQTQTTQAYALGNGLFQLLPPESYNPNVEHWEFRPGSIVRGTRSDRDGKPYLLATSFGS
jgi:hypothetical protein